MASAQQRRACRQLSYPILHVRACWAALSCARARCFAAAVVQMRWAGLGCVCLQGLHPGDHVPAHLPAQALQVLYGPRAVPTLPLPYGPANVVPGTCLPLLVQPPPPPLEPTISQQVVDVFDPSNMPGSMASVANIMASKGGKLAGQLVGTTSQVRQLLACGTCAWAACASRPTGCCSWL